MKTTGKEGFIYSQRSKKNNKKKGERIFGRIREGQKYESTSTSYFISIYRLRFTDYGRVYSTKVESSNDNYLHSPFTIHKQPVSLWGKTLVPFDVAKPASRPAVNVNASQAASLQP